MGIRTGYPSSYSYTENTGDNIRMKLRMRVIFLSLFFGLALCFSFSTEASAHDYPRSGGQKTCTHGDIESNVPVAFQRALTNGSGDVQNDLALLV